MNKLSYSAATRSVSARQLVQQLSLPLLMHPLKKQKSSKQKKGRDGAQTTSPSPASHAGGLANPLASTSQLAGPLNPADKLSNTLSIRLIFSIRWE